MKESTQLSGLIIKEPYISYILDGDKTWEMRSTKTKKRGRIALIKKATGQVWGTANIIDVIGPLSRSGMLSNLDKHHIDEALIRSGEVDKWKYAWVLDDIQPLPSPVAYQHKSGAVIWVSLSEEESSDVLGLPVSRMDKIKHHRTIKHDGETISIEINGDISKLANAKETIQELAMNTLGINSRRNVRASAKHVRLKQLHDGEDELVLEVKGNINDLENIEVTFYEDEGKEEQMPFLKSQDISEDTSITGFIFFMLVIGLMVFLLS